MESMPMNTTKNRTYVYKKTSEEEEGPFYITIKEYGDQATLERDRDGFVGVSNECFRENVTSGSTITLDGKEAIAHDYGSIDLPGYIDGLSTRFAFDTDMVDALMEKVFVDLYIALGCMFNNNVYDIDLLMHNVTVHIPGNAASDNDVFSVANLDQGIFDVNLPGAAFDETGPGDTSESDMMKTMNSLFLLMLHIACTISGNVNFVVIKGYLQNSTYHVLISNSTVPNSIAWAVKTVDSESKFLEALGKGYVKALIMAHGGEPMDEAFEAMRSEATSYDNDAEIETSDPFEDE